MNGERSSPVPNDSTAREVSKYPSEQPEQDGANASISLQLHVLSPVSSQPSTPGEDRKNSAHLVAGHWLYLFCQNPALAAVDCYPLGSHAADY